MAKLRGWQVSVHCTLVDLSISARALEIFNVECINSHLTVSTEHSTDGNKMSSSRVTPEELLESRETLSRVRGC